MSLSYLFSWSTKHLQIPFLGFGGLFLIAYVWGAEVKVSNSHKLTTKCQSKCEEEGADVSATCQAHRFAMIDVMDGLTPLTYPKSSRQGKSKLSQVALMGLA